MSEGATAVRCDTLLLLSGSGHHDEGETSVRGIVDRHGAFPKISACVFAVQVERWRLEDLQAIGVRTIDLEFVHVQPAVLVKPADPAQFHDEDMITGSSNGRGAV